MKKFFLLVVLFSIISSSLYALPVLAEESNPSLVSAQARIQTLAEKEQQANLVDGATKIIGGGLLIVGGAGIATAGNIVVRCILLPVGLAVQTDGVFSALEGTKKVVIGSNTFEKDYNMINSLEPEKKELYAEECLKIRAEEARNNRQPKLENLFGLFSTNETLVEKEYNDYLKDQNS